MLSVEVDYWEGTAYFHQRMEEACSSRSRRTPKKRKLDDIDTSNDKRYRKCENSGCPAERPICCADLSNGCSGTGYTSRWYHVSNGEHFCNACFDHMYRSHKGGYDAYAQWKFDWGGCCQREATVKSYVAETIMDYWVKCIKCGKWRQLPRIVGDLTSDVVDSWFCRMSGKGKKKALHPCQEPEDQRVADSMSPGWLCSLVESPLLKNSPAAPYLKSYFADGVGLSPVLNADTKEKDEVHKSTGYIQPFYDPEVGVTAFTFRPDTMEQEEKEYFPGFAGTREVSIIYLALRNLILALWASSYKETLTIDKCSKHIITRGLARLPLIQEANCILYFLSVKGVVNHGIITGIPPTLSSQPNSESVVIVGAGASGLAAARHLGRFGIKVIVLEARDRIGGRVWDDHSLGCCVGRGAQILNGCTNNPISILCEQLGVPMRHISGHCDLLGKDGRIADLDVDNKVEFHFNAILDANAEWRKGKSRTEDLSLEERIQEMHKIFLDETHLEFSEEENQLLQFHLGNLEYSCAAPLSQVSALYWDQNEQYPQFSGDHTLLVEGFEKLLRGLAKDLDIRLNSQVANINYSENKVVITTEQGMHYTADKVLVTLPLAVLKSEKVKFSPPLPAAKREAISNLGAGLIEKVAMKFPNNFWSKKVESANFFGRIPASSNGRDSCGVFYDLNAEGSPKKCNVLMTVLSGVGAKNACNMTDEQIIKQCVETLKTLFPEQTIAKPIKYLVSRWGEDPYAGMAYSYVPVGCSGQEYDNLAREVDNKVFFAGEATNRHFPQTVTGAYLSGIREAFKILFARSPKES